MATTQRGKRPVGDRPIMVVLDLLGRRWALRVLWELRGDALSFRALRERCDEISPSVLNARVAELRDANLVEATEDGYALSAEGRALGELLVPLDGWARRWAAGPARRSRSRSARRRT